MALTVKKTASCVLQLVQVDIVNEKNMGPLFNHGATDLQTASIMCVQYITEIS